MLSREVALGIAEQYFPSGPENIAERAGVSIRYLSLPDNVSGWCLKHGEKAIVTINENHTSVRRRFTLAHEIAHLILGSHPHRLNAPASACEVFDDEEREINELAGEILFPIGHLKALCPAPPLDAAGLTRIAGRAKASLVATARRLVHIARDLGLGNAGVAYFEGGVFKWSYSPTLTVFPSRAVEMLAHAMSSHPKPYSRATPQTGRATVAFVLESPYGSILFLQRLPAHLAKNNSEGENIRELEEYLFKDDYSFRCSLNGCFGAFNRASNLVGVTLEEAVEKFFATYAERYVEARQQSRVMSERGREYVRLKCKIMIRSITPGQRSNDPGS